MTGYLLDYRVQTVHRCPCCPTTYRIDPTEIRTRVEINCSCGTRSVCWVESS